MGKNDYIAMLGKYRDDVARIQSVFPEIGYEWFRGMSQRKIVEEYQLVESGFGSSENSAAVIVRAALRGVYGANNIVDIKGLLERDFYDSVAKIRKEGNIVRYNRMGGNGGFVSWNEVDIRDVSRKGVKSRGHIPRQEGEWELCYLLRKTENLTAKDIACVLNEEFHDGAGIRTEKAVANMLYKYRKSL